jgi:hypothetical protein
LAVTRVFAHHPHRLPLLASGGQADFPIHKNEKKLWIKLKILYHLPFSKKTVNVSQD